MVLGENFSFRKIAVSLLGDHIGLEVENLFEIFQGHGQGCTDSARQAFEEPDVCDRRGEVDVPESLAPHLGLDHLNSTLFAHHAPVPHPLVLAAVALVVLCRTEDLCAEQTVSLGLECAVIDSLRLLDLSVRPYPDLLRCGERDPYRPETQRVFRFFEEVKQVFQGNPLFMR